MMLVTIITVHLVVLFSRVATGQEMVREKQILQGQGKVRKFYSESGKTDILKKSQGKLNYNFIFR